MRDDFEKLKQQAAEYANEMLDQHIDEASGDSPIEKLLFAALRTRAWLGASEFDKVVRVETEEREKSIMDYLMSDHWSLAHFPHAGATTLLIRPQAEIENRRVDFLIHAVDWRD